jgi:hypothetical protein
MHSPLRSFPILLTLVVGFVLVCIYAVKRPLPLVRAALLPVQPLQLQMGPNGATIQALFGRFPAVPGPCSTKSISKSSGGPASAAPPPLVCNSPGCPYGSVDLNGGCIINRVGRPVAICLNGGCRSWECPMASQGKCCEICTWQPGSNCYGDDGCATNGYC